MTIVKASTKRQSTHQISKVVRQWLVSSIWVFGCYYRKLHLAICEFLLWKAAIRSVTTATGVSPRPNFPVTLAADRLVLLQITPTMGPHSSSPDCLDSEMRFYLRRWHLITTIVGRDDEWTVGIIAAPLSALIGKAAVRMTRDLSRTNDALWQRHW